MFASTVALDEYAKMTTDSMPASLISPLQRGMIGERVTPAPPSA